MRRLKTFITVVAPIRAVFGCPFFPTKSSGTTKMTFITVVAPIGALFGHPFGNYVATQEEEEQLRFYFFQTKKSKQLP